VHPNKNIRRPTSEDALEVEIQHLHKHKALIDLEQLYNSAASADDLNSMLNLLKKHMGIKSHKVRAAFSDQIVDSGYCMLDRTSTIIYVNSAYTGKPALCASVLAHNICHFALIELHKITFEDRNENEKAADLASIAYGFGLVVLSGAAPFGWRIILPPRKRTKRLRPGLGYFSLKTYAQKTSRRLLDLHLTPLEVAQNSCAWVNRLLDPHLRYRGARTTTLMRETQVQHRTSIRNFSFSMLIYLLCLLTFVYVIVQKPIFLGEDLKLQKSKIEKLHISYQGCVDRVMRLQKNYDEQDAQVARFIDSERNLCKSLQNRYNHEINVYSEMQTRYEQ
jgi:hypothetical protein